MKFKQYFFRTVIILVGCFASIWVYQKYSESNAVDTFKPSSMATKVIPPNLVRRDPVDIKASDGVKKLLSYHYDLALHTKENTFIVGQHTGSASNISYEMSDPFEGKRKNFDELATLTGKTPAIMGLDYGWEEMNPEKILKANSLLIEHWHKGGLVEVDFHPTNPWTKNGLRDFGTGAYAYADIYTEGSEPNKEWNRELDAVAVGLKELQDEGVVVLFRPLHEVNGDWYWWSYGATGRVTPTEYQKLWTYVFSYMSEKKALHNLVWVYSPNASLGNPLIKSPVSYYPGDAYVDIVGLDFYMNDYSILNVNGDYDAMVALGKPFGLAEVGPPVRTQWFDNRVLADAINSKYPNVIFTMHWNGWPVLGGITYQNQSIMETGYAHEFMNDEQAITLESLKIR